MKLRICPKCFSIRVKPNTRIDETLVALGVETQYECLDCGFVGSVFPKIEKDELERLRCELKSKLKLTDQNSK